MSRLKDFATDHPLTFVLLTIVAWTLTGAAGTALATVLLSASFFDPLPQSLGTLAATTFILILTWRFGWLKAAGIANLGSWLAWLVALGAFIYLILAYNVAFFGEISFNLSDLTSSSETSAIFWRQILVGTVEEILFRGFVLYSLVRVWGKTKRGLTAAVLVSAFLFGIVHLLQAVAGNSLEVALLNTLEGFVSGIWFALFVLTWSTLWPVAAIHAGSNMMVILKALSEPGITLTGQGYAMAIFLQIPLVILGFWWLSKQKSRGVIFNSP
jgi:membrane protease YdiL (CAAX protease family)